MRRFIALILSASLSFLFCQPILAAEITSIGGTELTPIKVSYDLVTAEAEEVYYVDVMWGSLENTYKTNDEKIWNPETLTFEIKNGTPEWVCANGANAVGIANHSNAAITALFSYSANANYSSVSGSFDKSLISLAAPVEGSAYSSAPADRASLTLSGTLDADAGTKVKVGTVSVQIVGEDVGAYGFAGNGTSYPFYKQAEDIYLAYFTAAVDSPAVDTVISIDGTDYYICELHSDRADGDKAYTFRAGMTVKIGTEKNDLYKKATELTAGKTYTILIDTANLTASMSES